MIQIKGLDAWSLQFSKLGPIGSLPIAPGTWGSLVSACVFSWGFVHLPWLLKIFLLGLVFILGGMAASRAEIVLQTKDPGEVVIDEALGQLIPFFFFKSINGYHLILAFILFRIFDIFKPWPIRDSENWLKGGFGVMLDDVLAGIYALIGLMVINLILSGIKMIL